MDGSAPDGAGGGGGYRGVSELGDRRRKALFRVKMLSPLFHGGGVLQREDLRARRGGATGCGQASQEKRRKVAHFDDRDVVHTLLQGCVSWDDNVVREALNQVSTKMLSEYISSREMFDAVHTAEVLFTPLLFACIHGNCGAVKELVARGAPLEKGVVGNSVTPLYAAAHYGHEDIVKVLCAAGALVNASQSDGASVLYAACKQGHLDTVRLLKQYNANVNICKSNGVTSLHVAAQNGHWQVCSFLIKVMGMDVHKCSDTGSTPLHLAVFQKREMVVRTLLENGADVDATDEWGWTPLHVAAQAGNTNIIHLLVVSPVVPKSTLHVEAKTISEDLLTHWGGCKDKSGPLQGVDWSSCDLKELRTDAICLLRLNRRKKDEYTPLMVACRSGADVSAAQYLLDMGANPRMKLSDGITPLMIAAKQGHLVYVQMLSKCLSRNDFLAHTTVQMWNALHWAAKGGRVSVVRFLLSLKDEKTIFTPDIQNQNMMTPLYIACHHGNLEVVKCLVEEFGADTNRMIGQHAITPLYTACKHGHVNVVRYLYGRSSTIRPSSSLFTAAKYDRVRVARFLVEEADLDPLEERNAQGWTPIHSAARAGATKVLDYFVNRLGASAVVCCKTETIQQAAGLREQAEEGDRLFGKYTPLHLAASNGRMGAVRYLVGPPVWADLEELSTRGHTAEMLAHTEGYFAVSDWLRHAKEWSSLHFYADTNQIAKIKELLFHDEDAGRCLLRPTKISGDVPLTIACRAALGNESFQKEVEATIIANASYKSVVPKLLSFINSHCTTQKLELWGSLSFSVATVGLLVRAMSPWCVDNHKLFPPNFRYIVKTMMLVNYRLGLILPMEILFQIMAFIPR